MPGDGFLRPVYIAGITRWHSNIAGRAFAERRSGARAVASTAHAIQQLLLLVIDAEFTERLCVFLLL